MEELRELMIDQLNQIETDIQKLQSQLTDSISGNLIIDANKDSLQFYFKSGGRRRYLSKRKEQEMIIQLLQKKHDEKYLKLLNQRKRAITAFLKKYPYKTYDDIWSNFPTGCQKVLIPFKTPIARRLYFWETKSFKQKEINLQTKSFKTIHGEMVRSKSEKIIADLLYHWNVPYRYEMACTLNNLGTIYPDFTIYDVRNNRLVYLEHFGMADDPAYSQKMVVRYNDYLKSGFADQLIISMESSTQPLDVSALIPLIKPYSLTKADD